MEQYIPKSALVAEIERRKQTYQHQDQQYVNGGKDVCDYLLGFLDTLEVKEVDLNREIRRYRMRNPIIQHREESLYDYMANVAKHFFELGLSVNNPITAEDKGTAEEIIINLKRIENDYRIDLTKEIEWLRNKVKKRR